MRHFIGGFFGGDVLLIMMTAFLCSWKGNGKATVNGATIIVWGMACGLAAWGLFP